MGAGSEPHKPVYEPTTDSRSSEDETARRFVFDPKKAIDPRDIAQIDQVSWQIESDGRGLSLQVWSI